MIFHPIACLFSLRMSNRLFSCKVLSREDMTTRHYPCSSKYAYFSSAGRGLRSSFSGSLFPSSINKGRISSFFLHCSCIVFNLGLPAALQNSQIAPQLAHPAFATDQLVPPELYRLCKLPLVPLPLVTYAFYSSGRC